MFPQGVGAEALRAAVESAGGGQVWSVEEWERVFARLTILQQRVVYKRVLLGLAPSEIARLLGLGRGSVDGAWRRALDRIRTEVPPPN